MRTLTLFALFLLALPASAQQLDLTLLESLKAKADNSVVVDVDPALMQFAAAFLSEQDQEEQAALQIIDKLEAIQVRIFSFSEDGGYSAGDLAPIYTELDTDGWNGIVQVEGGAGDDNVGIWIHQAASEVDGLAVLVEGSSEVIVANIVGSINPQDIAALGSQFGFPTGGFDFDLEEILEQFGPAIAGQGADQDSDGDEDYDD